MIKHLFNLSDFKMVAVNEAITSLGNCKFWEALNTHPRGEQPCNHNDNNENLFDEYFTNFDDYPVQVLEVMKEV